MVADIGEHELQTRAGQDMILVHCCVKSMRDFYFHENKITSKLTSEAWS